MNLLQALLHVTNNSDNSLLALHLCWRLITYLTCLYTILFGVHVNLGSGFYLPFTDEETECRRS